MPTIYTNDGQEARHTAEIENIISNVPSWLLRWGITLFFGLLILIVLLSNFIKYPDIVNCQLKIHSETSLSGQKVFYVQPLTGHFNGEMYLTANDIITVKNGQPVLLILNGIQLTGQIRSIADTISENSLYLAKADFSCAKFNITKIPIKLKQGTMFEGKIVTQNATILQRISRSLFKMGN